MGIRNMSWNLDMWNVTFFSPYIKNWSRYGAMHLIQARSYLIFTISSQGKAFSRKITQKPLKEKKIFYILSFVLHNLKVFVSNNEDLSSYTIDKFK